MEWFDQDIQNAIEIARKYYDESTFAHASRVAGFVEDNPFIPIIYKTDCICLAWMHDLLEDTSYKNEPKFVVEKGFLNELVFDEALYLLTKPKDMDYISYIKRFKDEQYSAYARQYAWWVKIADMKDHLSRTETLTDRLKEKYLEALPYLL